MVGNTGENGAAGREGIPGLLVADRYRLVESIGRGGMGRVWRAVDEILDRLVAVKEIRIDGQDAEDERTRRERTLREARATARIDHPNVVRVYDVVGEGERLWIVMELVGGRSLERLTAERALDPREAARIGLGLVAALRQVHARGVLHRDIKPANVLVDTDNDRIVLTDFGIAAIQDTKALTMAGVLVGSPDYMAPERISGRRQGPPSDLWSLGATLCAALAGHSPFSRETTMATLVAVLHDEPRLPDGAGPLRPLLEALLHKEPAARPALDAVEEALRAVAEPAGTDAAERTAGERTVVEGLAAPLPAKEGFPATQGPAAGERPGRGEPPPEPRDAPPARTPPDPRLPAGPSASAPPAAPPEPVRHTPHPEPAGQQPLPQPTPQPSPPASRPPHPALTSTVSPHSATTATTRRPELPGPPGASAPRFRRRTALTAAVGVLAAVAVAAVAVTVLPGDDKTPAQGKGGSSVPVSASSPSASSPAPTVAGTSRAPTLPPGAHREAGGFAWVTPEGWRRNVRTGSEVHYTSPDGTQELAAKASLSRGRLIDNWEKSERDAQRGREYRKIRLEETTYRGHPAVVWEYTFVLDGAPWHAHLLGFTTGGRTYQVNTWYRPGAEQRALRIYEDVKDSFTVL
ncbi:protein kinase [Streptomyces sp. NPDC006186]|uniref:serine/threonine-protein kinase n=1 Tax=Streptomyces sp. NPDC006186 TaxID=3155248 RepID=UPI0033BED89A